MNMYSKVFYLRNLSRGHGDFFIHLETVRISQGPIFILKVLLSLINK